MFLSIFNNKYAVRKILSHLIHEEFRVWTRFQIDLLNSGEIDNFEYIFSVICSIFLGSRISNFLPDICPLPLYMSAVLPATCHSACHLWPYLSNYLSSMSPVNVPFTCHSTCHLWPYLSLYLTPYLSPVTLPDTLPVTCHFTCRHTVMWQVTGKVKGGR